MDGVLVMVGVNVMVGVKVIVGVIVMVGVCVMVGEGGKTLYTAGSPNLPMAKATTPNSRATKIFLQPRTNKSWRFRKNGNFNPDRIVRMPTRNTIKPPTAAIKIAVKTAVRISRFMDAGMNEKGNLLGDYSMYGKLSFL